MKKLLISLVVVVLVVPLVGCAKLEGGGASCAIETADNPHQSKRTPSDIVAKARYGCRGGARAVTVRVDLQKKAADRSWVTVATQTQTTSNPRDGKEYTVQVVTLCEDGTFRSRSTITSARSESGKTMTGRNTEYVTSREVKNPCA